MLSTKAGDVELAIPKLREGSFYPSLLEPRRRIDRALWAVIMEAFVHGVSTRKVDDLVTALGIDAGVSKSQVSRICAELDGAVAEFRERRLDHIEFPYVFLDATYVKAHEGARVVSKAIIVATGVAADGNREVLGLAVGDSEDTGFWTPSSCSLMHWETVNPEWWVPHRYVVVHVRHEGNRQIRRLDAGESGPGEATDLYRLHEWAAAQQSGQGQHLYTRPHNPKVADVRSSAVVATAFRSRRAFDVETAVRRSPYSSVAVARGRFHRRLHRFELCL